MTHYWPKGLTAHLARHPGDIGAVTVAGWRLRRSRWWASPPFLPLPDENYWHFRMITAYGEDDAAPTVDDVVAAARWSRRQRRTK